MKSLTGSSSYKALIVVLVLVLTGWAHPAGVSAATEFNQQIAFTDDFDSCLGEHVTVDGIQHIVGRFTKDASGKLHFGFTRNTRGTGIGQSTGDAYILRDTVARTSLEIVPGEPRELLQGYQSILTHHGEDLPDDDTVIHFLSKISVSANGEVSTEIDVQRVECR